MIKLYKEMMLIIRKIKMIILTTIRMNCIVTVIKTKARQL